MIGLDLAWGTRATTGACALSISLRGGAVCNLVSVREDLFDDDEILAWISSMCAKWGGAGVMLAVDAPLCVPNTTGDRPCDNETRRRFSRYHAGPHPANRNLLGDDPRGERLVRLLGSQGFRLDATLHDPRTNPGRIVFEVFPHPAHIVLFGRSKIIPYKAKSGRSPESRAAAMLEYGDLLRRLCRGERTWFAAEAQDADCSESMPLIDLPEGWPLSSDPITDLDIGGVDKPYPHYTSLPRGGRLKKYEDGLDALTCALVAYWYWWNGPAGVEVLGDPTAGHIVVPRIPRG